MDNSTKWILDTDCGLDDAQAVLLAIHYLDVVGKSFVLTHSIQTPFAFVFELKFEFSHNLC